MCIYIYILIIIPPWFKGMHILKEVCYMMAALPSIYFFYDSVIISWEHLKRSTCQAIHMTLCLFLFEKYCVKCTKAPSHSFIL